MARRGRASITIREMARFFGHWLAGRETGIMDEPPIDDLRPAARSAARRPPLTSGFWRHERDWPLERGQ